MQLDAAKRTTPVGITAELPRKKFIRTTASRWGHLHTDAAS